MGFDLLLHQNWCILVSYNFRCGDMTRFIGGDKTNKADEGKWRCLDGGQRLDDAAARPDASVECFKSVGECKIMGL